MTDQKFKLKLGAMVNGDRTDFRVWAPHVSFMSTKVVKGGQEKIYEMTKDDDGYFSCQIAGVGHGDCYAYTLENDRDRPDPVSRYLPETVHETSMIWDPTLFQWSDAKWKGIDLKDYLIYELHVGTFTKQGDFDSLIERLDYLQSLGVTCIEIMPVAQFPGVRNWGYDGVGLYAVQNSYGGPDGLKRFVDACHKKGMAVCLDVVYNHFGPEGNYLREFGNYFTDKYKTPWGEAINYDGMDSPVVREFIINNALYWIQEYHVDALRLDAIHGIFDTSPKHVLQEFAENVHELAMSLGRQVHVIAESDLNDSKIVSSPENNGYGLDSQWADDFHHALHVALTNEKKGYYQDYSGIPSLVKSLRQGFVYDGIFSEHRKRSYGTSAEGLNGEQFVVCLQNHDQIGNRAHGDRLSASLNFRQQKLGAGVLLLSPFLPLLYMGQEYGELAPFQYFIDHGDENLVEAVRNGRKEEFKSFGWDDLADPDDPATFERSKLNWDLLNEDGHRGLLQLYRDLICIRKDWISRGILERDAIKVKYREGHEGFSVCYGDLDPPKYAMLVSFSNREILLQHPFGKRPFRTLLDASSQVYGEEAVTQIKQEGETLFLPPYTFIVLECIG